MGIDHRVRVGIARWVDIRADVCYSRVGVRVWACALVIVDTMCYTIYKQLRLTLRNDVLLFMHGS